MIKERVQVGDRSYVVNRYKRGEGCVVICISMPVDDIAALDEAAEQMRKTRSGLIREAVIEYVERRRP